MADVVVLGEASRTAWFALAGAKVLPAETPDEARAAWSSLRDERGVVILTPMAAEAVAGAASRGRRRLLVVLPSATAPGGPSGAVTGSPAEETR